MADPPWGHIEPLHEVVDDLPLTAQLSVQGARRGTSTQQFTWDTSGSVPELLEDGANYYLWVPGTGSAPIEQITIDGSIPTYLVSDTTGVREQIGSSGSVVGAMTYDSFGNPCECSMSTPFGFEGGYTDSTGLIYLVNRYYDPSTGRFLSVDPEAPLTGQPYAYTDDDPVNAIDPDGLDCGIFSVVCGAYDAVAGGVKGAVSSVGTHVEDYGEFYAGLVVIVGADSMATAVLVAGFPEDLVAAPAEVGLFGYVLSAANGLGLYLIYKSLGRTRPKPAKPDLQAPGLLGTQTNSQLTSWPDFRRLAAHIIMCAVVIDVVAACAINVVTHDAKRPDGRRPSTSELGP